MSFFEVEKSPELHASLWNLTPGERAEMYEAIGHYASGGTECEGFMERRVPDEHLARYDVPFDDVRVGAELPYWRDQDPHPLVHAVVASQFQVTARRTYPDGAHEDNPEFTAEGVRECIILFRYLGMIGTEPVVAITTSARITREVDDEVVDQPGEPDTELTHILPLLLAIREADALDR